MASTLLSHTRKLPRSHLSYLFLHPHFRLSSSDSTSPLPPPPPIIEPVSYSPKPKPIIETPQQKHNVTNDDNNNTTTTNNLTPSLSPQDNINNASSSFSPNNFTKEDLRYIKDLPLSISPVSYPKRVAPLPEDRAPAQETVELERESRSIEANNRAIRRVFKVAEEQKDVPFPTFIKVDDDKKRRDRKVFDLQDAIRQVKANAKRNFDETLEAHVNVGIDRRRSDLGVSGAVVLPHGTGKIVKVAVFAEGAEAEEARAAGADIVGAEDLIEEIKTSGKINFDKCIATHSMMQRVTKIGRILRGLTPNAKKGTVTNNVASAVKEAKQGLLDFRMKDAIVHVGLGKVSFAEEALHENIGAFVNALLLAKPAGLKKSSKYAGYVNSFHLCSTMGPGFPITIQSLSRAADLYNKLHTQ